MTCPHCGHLSSRFSEICTDCGARIRVRKASSSSSSAPKQQKRKSRSGRRKPTPTPTQTLYSTIRKTVASSAPVRQAAVDQVRHRATSPQLVTVDARLLALVVGGVTVGWLWGRSSVPPRAAEEAPIAVPVQPPAPLADIAPTTMPMPPASFSPGGSASLPPLSPSTPSRPFASSPVSFGSTANADTILKHLKDARALKLIDTYAVPALTRLEVGDAYFQWKRAHSRPSFAGSILSFYAPDAKIYRRPGELISRDNLVFLASQASDVGLNTEVSDLAPPQWRQNADGSRVELLSAHRYSHDGGGWTSGQRRLVWQKRGAKWVIVRDDLPPLRVPEEQSPVTP